MRGTVWAVAREPFRRQSPSNKYNELDSESVYTAFWNAWDLMLNARGIGWNWPRGLVVPKSAFETDWRITFVLLSTAQLALHALAFDACLQIICMLSPDTFGSLNGGSLFDHTLPPLLELVRSRLGGLDGILYDTVELPISGDRMRCLVPATPLSIATPFRFSLVVHFIVRTLGSSVASNNT